MFDRLFIAARPTAPAGREVLARMIRQTPRSVLPTFTKLLRRDGRIGGIGGIGSIGRTGRAGRAGRSGKAGRAGRAGRAGKAARDGMMAAKWRSKGWAT